MTPASQAALHILRDPARLEWYVVPLLALTVYAYATEVGRRDYGAALAGLAFWGMDWLNEIANAVILHATGRSALWTAPGKTAYLVLVGLNVEICFMFSIAGLAMVKLLPRDRRARVLGLPNRLFVGLASSVFCVVVEIFLNRAGLLVWEYGFWSFPHVWLIVPFGYLHFHLVAFWVFDLPTLRQQVRAVAVLYALVLTSAGVFGALGWI